MPEAANPTLMGVDVIFVATLLAAVATMAVIVAIYAATTVRDPMAKRVKALNERREQLKAGITASTAKKRTRIVHKNDTTDKMRSTLQSLRVSAGRTAQGRAAEAGAGRYPVQGCGHRHHLRSHDPAHRHRQAGAALAIYGFEVVATDWTPMKKFGLFAALLIGSYKAPDLFVQNKITKRTAEIRKGLPDALDLLVICAEAGLTVDAAFNRVAKELGRAYPELGDEFALTAIELAFLTERRQAFENLAYRVALDSVTRRGDDHDPDRKIRYAARFRLARAVRRIPQRAHDARRRKGRPPARDHDRPADPVHPADAVRRHPGPGCLLDRRRFRQAVIGRVSSIKGAPKQKGRCRNGIAPVY